LADAWEIQVEHVQDTKSDEAPINTYEWMIENDLLPTYEDEMC